MPDLSVLIQIAEFYEVEVKEILDGERKGEIMDKELKETLSKVADYNSMEKEKVLKIGNTAFGFMFAVCVAIIVVQLLITDNLSLVAGETAILLAGGIFYLGVMIYHGLWEKGSKLKNTIVVQLLITDNLSLVAGETAILLAGGIFYLGVMIYHGLWEKGSKLKNTPFTDGVITDNLSLVAGETAILLAGGIFYLGVMIYHGLWEKGSKLKNTPFTDGVISIICAGVFSALLAVVYLKLGASVTKQLRLLPCFLSEFQWSNLGY